MPLEVPFYDAPVLNLNPHQHARQLGTLFGRDGTFTGDAGCGCHPLWWLLAAAVAGAALGVGIRKSEKGQRRTSRRSG